MTDFNPFFYKPLILLIFSKFVLKIVIYTSLTVIVKYVITANEKLKHIQFFRTNSKDTYTLQA